MDLNRFRINFCVLHSDSRERCRIFYFLYCINLANNIEENQITCTRCFEKCKNRIFFVLSQVPLLISLTLVQFPMKCGVLQFV